MDTTQNLWNVMTLWEEVLVAYLMNLENRTRMLHVAAESCQAGELAFDWIADIY
jgi:hypothetical protein